MLKTIKMKVLEKLEKTLGHNTYDSLDCGFAVDFTLEEVKKLIEEEIVSYKDINAPERMALARLLSKVNKNTKQS